MNSKIAMILCIAISAPISLNEANAQLKKEQLVGTWSFVSAENTRPDGTKFDPNGGKATKGLLMFDAAGRFSWQIIQTDIPNIASGNRLNGTPEEDKAVARGVLSFYGAYSVEDPKVLKMQIENSSFPNFRGATQSRTATLAGDDLSIVNAAGASGGTAEVKWKRAK